MIEKILSNDYISDAKAEVSVPVMFAEELSFEWWPCAGNGICAHYCSVPSISRLTCHTVVMDDFKFLGKKYERFLAFLWCVFPAITTTLRICWWIQHISIITLESVLISFIANVWAITRMLQEFTPQSTLACLCQLSKCMFKEISFLIMIKWILS